METATIHGRGTSHCDHAVETAWIDDFPEHLSGCCADNDTLLVGVLHGFGNALVWPQSPQADADDLCPLVHRIRNGLGQEIRDMVNDDGVRDAIRNDGSTRRSTEKWILN